MRKTINTLITILLVLVISLVFFIGVDYFKSRIKAPTMTGLTSETQFEKNVEREKIVTKIIDGDTVIIEGEIVRLLGIDADERGDKCYDAARKKLDELLLNKFVDLEYFNEDTDYYGRKLRYIILDGENINLLLLRQGYVVARVSNDPYKELFMQAEKFARENKIGCKWDENWQEKQQTQQEQQQQKQQQQIQTQQSQQPQQGIIQACDAYRHIGKNATVEGLVVAVKKTTKAAFLNFEKPYPNQCFTAVIFASNFYKFPDFYSYKDKRIRVSGVIKEYEGKPEIIVENPNQIAIV